MQLVERQRAFTHAVQVAFGASEHSKVNNCFGVSNSAKVIEGGIQLGVPNLDSIKPAMDTWVLNCLIRFPPEDEVYFALKVQGDLANLRARLDNMKRLGAGAPTAAAGGDDEGDGDDGGAVAVAGAPPVAIAYSARNNVTATYLAAADGKLYFRNKKFWESLNFDMVNVGPGVTVDEIAVAVYPPDASARRSMLAREFVGYLGKFVGRHKVRELEVWPDAKSVSPTMRRMPDTVPVADIRRAIEDMGGHYVDRLVERFHEAANHLPDKHFVILSGLSGTGKTQLALKYAKAVHGLGKDDDDPLLFVCPVRPEWTDPTGLTGYHDVLTNQYKVPQFLEAVLVATAHRDSPVFVVLDEMNLARVEYYFSDVLSAMESRQPIQLHSNAVPLEGSIGGEVRAAVQLPPNLYVVGTINVDETTNTVSDKVLDRAVVIDMSAVDLPGFLAKLDERDPALAPSIAAAAGLLSDLNALLLPNGQGFGYRVAEELVRYHAFASVRLGRDSAEVLDDLLVQKVLVKLRGGYPQRDMLDGLESRVAGFARASEVVARMKKELDDLGSFRYGR